MKPTEEGYYIDKDGRREDVDMLHNVEAGVHEIADSTARMMIAEMRKNGWEEWMIQHTYPDVYEPPTAGIRLKALLGR